MATNEFQPVLQKDLEVTILNGQTTSNAVDVMGTSILAFITDAALDGVAFTFLASDALEGTYLPLHRMIDGTIITAVVAASQHNATSPEDFMSVRFLKIVSGAAQSGANTVIKIVNRRLA